jgi:pimeloyl-ACP methyl ester carboxylesterase
MSKIKKICDLLFNLVVLFSFLVIVSCSDKGVEPDQKAAGDIINSHTITNYTAAEITQVLNIFQIPISFQLQYPVKCISIEYQSEDINGNEINLSGALYIPQTESSMPLLSIQHGTETKNDLVASINPLFAVEGVTGLISASMGYVTSIPDYPGFGVSHSVHPYIHAASLSKSVIDFLRASRNYCRKEKITLDDKLYLAGYSEGGFATLATHKEIEENYFDEFTVSASVPMAGPYDLKSTTDFMLQQTTYNYPAYLAFFYYAYDELYNWNRMDEIFNSPYNAAIPSLFDGSNEFSEINQQLPTQVSALIKQDFINNYLNGNENALNEALAENSLLDWIPDAPIHFFHGDSDDAVPYQNSISAYNSLKSNGATDIHLTTIPGGTHATASMPSVVGALTWIDSLYTASKISANYMVSK